MDSYQSLTRTASSLSFTFSSAAAMSAGMRVLQKPVMRLKPPYVVMGMMPAAAVAAGFRDKKKLN